MGQGLLESKGLLGKKGLMGWLLAQILSISQIFGSKIFVG